MTAPHDRPAWAPGFFTGRLHAVLPDADRMVFRQVPIGWSMCGRAAVLEPIPHRSRAAPCDRCVHLAGPPPDP